MPDIADLFEEAGRRLRSDFEFIRRTNPHSGEKGEEIEGILKAFLNGHLPRRFAAGSGIMIDFDGNVSKQTDVIVYDALTSPVYRSAEKTQILPAHTVAAVMEVKTSLDGKSLRDSYEKIASCKLLKRPSPSNMDRPSTEGGLSVTGTMGVVFAFDSPLTMDRIAEHAEELNNEFDSDVWPDIIVILDKGVITYGIQGPGDLGSMSGLGTRPPRGDGKYYAPPWYVHMMLHRDGNLSLNRFFMLLLMQTAFFPFRHQMPPFKAFLRSETTEAMAITGYQLTQDERLIQATSEQFHGNSQSRVRWEIHLHAPEGQRLAQIQYFDWAGGGVIRGAGIPLQPILQMCLPDPKAMIMSPAAGLQISNILPLDLDTFKGWPAIITAKSNLNATLHDLG